MPTPPPPPGQARGTRSRPGLTPDKIAAAGCRLVERDGLSALTMRALALDMGTAATSLYRHVADRDALLVAMLEQIAAGLPLAVPGADPRDRLVERLALAHDYLVEHVWVMHVLTAGEMVAQNALPFTECCLVDLLRCGLSTGQAEVAFDACWHLLIGELLDFHPPRPPRHPNQRDHALNSLDQQRLPTLAALREHRRRLTPHDFRTEIAPVIDAFVRAASLNAH